MNLGDVDIVVPLRDGVVASLGQASAVVELERVRTDFTVVAGIGNELVGSANVVGANVHRSYLAAS